MSTLQKTSLANFSSFLAWSGLEKVLITIGHCPMGSQQSFSCVLCHFRHGNTQMNKQTTGDQLKKTDVKKYFFSPEHILWLHTKLYFSWHFQSHHSSLKYCRQSPCPVGFLPPRPQYVKFKTPPSDHFQTPSCTLSVPPIHNASFPFIPLSVHFRKMYRFIDCEGTDARFAPLCVHLCTALSQLSIELLQ